MDQGGAIAHPPWDTSCARSPYSTGDGLLQRHQGRDLSGEAKPGVVNNTDVLALFAEHNLVLVLQGHMHVSELLRWRSTTFIAGGAVCGKWWRGPYFGTEEGFNAVTLRRDRVEWEYLNYGWRARRPAGK